MSMPFWNKESQTSNAQNRKRKLISITISPEMVAWIDHEVSTGVFRNRSHGFETCVRQTIGQLRDGKHLRRI
jgi:Arc/MetJ-type ribon-helix-helix transcriptional regulator